MSLKYDKTHTSTKRSGAKSLKTKNNVSQV